MQPSTKHLSILLLGIVNLAESYNDCRIECPSNMANTVHNSPEWYSAPSKAKTYVLVYKRPDENFSDGSVKMQSDQCFVNVQKQPVVPAPDCVKMERQPAIVRGQPESIYSYKQPIPSHRQYEVGQIYKQPLVDTKHYSGDSIDLDPSKKWQSNKKILEDSIECECSVKHSDEPVIHTETQWVTATKVVLETEIVRETEREFETERRDRKRYESSVEAETTTFTEKFTESVTIPPSIAYTQTEKIPITITETSLSTIPLTSTVTEPSFITVTRIETETCTMEVPLTLFREVVSTVTSEKPIINYKVTTLTDMSISYKTIEHTETETETQYKTFTETEEVTVTKTKTSTEVKFEKSVDTKTETKTDIKVETTTETSIETTVTTTTDTITDLSTIYSTVFSTIHDTTVSTLYDTIISTFHDTSLLTATEVITTTDLVDQTITSTDVFTETATKTEILTDLSTQTSILSTIITTTVSIPQNEPIATSNSTQEKDITKIFIPLLEKLFERANVETKQEPPIVQTVTQKEIQTVFSDARHQNLSQDFQVKTDKRFVQTVSKILSHRPVPEQIQYVTRRVPPQVDFECIEEPREKFCTTNRISDLLQDCPVEQYTTTLRHRRLSNLMNECIEDEFPVKNTQIIMKSISAHQKADDRRPIKRDVLLDDDCPGNNVECIDNNTFNHSYNNQSYPSRSNGFHRPQRTVINTFYEYKHGQNLHIPATSTMAKRPKNTVFKTVYVCQTDYSV